ncbi:glycosyltransferase family 4 protein [Marinomonas atlantica]|uniref:glycosyltransferase family 4 protein n=1 Tax=Marinomonas atlantica TaxID=1806668 RepID=UPI000A5AFA83|nr:glycosyltransferase family 4 protein [Marinomonas atlantica]
MNILHMCLSYGFGGLEMYPLRVGKQMRQVGHKVFGIALAQSSIDEAMSGEFDGCLAIPSRGHGYRNLLSLSKWIKQHNIQYVHCHKSSDLFLAVLLKKLCGFKLIYTDHMGVKKPKKDIFHRFIYRNVDQLLSISNFTLAFNKKALPIADARIQALWLGTSIPDHIQAGVDLKSQLKLCDEVSVVGIVGRLSPGKGHLELIKAMAKLEAERFHLVIIGGLNAKQGGDDEYIDKLKQYVSGHKLDKRITFYGFTPEPETLLPSIDVVVIPSHLEAFGLTVIESMAQGKAIIGSNAGAIPEILENTGILVDPFDSDALANAIAELCKNTSKRQALALSARDRAKQHFDQNVHVNKLLKIYQALD